MVNLHMEPNELKELNGAEKQKIFHVLERLCYEFLTTAVTHDTLRLGPEAEQKELEYKHMLFTLLVDKYSKDKNLGKLFLKRLG